MTTAVMTNSKSGHGALPTMSKRSIMQKAKESTMASVSERYSNEDSDELRTYHRLCEACRSGDLEEVQR